MRHAFKRGDRVRLKKDAKRRLRNTPTPGQLIGVGEVAETPRPNRGVHVRFPKGDSGGYLPAKWLEKVR